jgi:hypothetical protein
MPSTSLIGVGRHHNEIKAAQTFAIVTYKSQHMDYTADDLVKQYSESFQASYYLVHDQEGRRGWHFFNALFTQ